jgi:hypothetical protein
MPPRPPPLAATGETPIEAPPKPVDPLTGPPPLSLLRSPPLPPWPRSGDETAEVVTPPDLEEGWSRRSEIERRDGAARTGSREGARSRGGNDVKKINEVKALHGTAHNAARGHAAGGLSIEAHHHAYSFR